VKIHHRRNMSSNKYRSSGAGQHCVSILDRGRRIRVQYTDNQTIQEFVDRLVSVVGRREPQPSVIRCEEIYL
jgi:hypothetical protein